MDVWSLVPLLRELAGLPHQRKLNESLFLVLSLEVRLFGGIYIQPSAAPGPGRLPLKRAGSSAQHHFAPHLNRAVAASATAAGGRTERLRPLLAQYDAQHALPRPW
jgi:hypothetical protein